MAGLKETIVYLRQQQAAADVPDCSSDIARLEAITVDVLKREMTTLAHDVSRYRYRYWPVK